MGGAVSDGSARDGARMRILLVSENISLRLSGETLVPYYYLINLLAQGHDVHVLCHARVRDDLARDLPSDVFARFRFVEDGRAQAWLFAAGGWWPHRVRDLVFNQLIQALSQLRMRKIARAMVAELGKQVVFQPAPIAATAISTMYGLGVPVAIGPMSGGMDLPPAFRTMDSLAVRFTIRSARRAAGWLHRLIPGKLRAAALIVANQQTRDALPPGVTGRIHVLRESGVDLERWRPAPREGAPDRPVRFIFCSRFVDWKGIAFLVRAFAPLARAGGVRLDLVGDGELFGAVAAQIARERLEGSIILHGRLPLEGYVALLRKADVFVTPSLRECGGMAMMEAMALGLPVIGVNWGGAAHYAAPDCALLIDPASEAALITGLTAAMRRLAASRSLRLRMGQAARRHLEEEDLGWDAKARAVVAILRQTVREERARNRARRTPPAEQPAPRPMAAVATGKG
ncbi:glycosyltransferase family 4 protein [Hephaestia sp. GCM10023244]|uniref:glycosyltransferase family 4 protein n=1 Tax=unclassified Hephaestia TaxID=2631281 RepID=UPI00207775E3|nr:glycosyltransferase family 4 protein [Hephaestia sp. MAHUQ-44]MCM8731661.1 glycosyltransferase family 4 protein [Hephaestia sp. MAHUQ-44]